MSRFKTPASAVGLLVLGLIVAGTSSAFAQSLDVIPDLPLPQDRIAIPILAPRGGEVGRLSFVPGIEPVLRRTEVVSPPGPENQQHGTFRYELIYALAPDTGIGFLEPPFLTGYVDVGPMPVGTHLIRMVGQVNGDTVFERDVMPFSVQVSPQGRQDLSGWWYAPEQEGRGVFVSAHDNLSNSTTIPSYSFLWATHDAEGEPTWLLMTAVTGSTVEGSTQFSGEAILTRGAPPAPGAVVLEGERWGTLTFTYHACGAATLSWEADDARITDGTLELEQLVRVRGTRDCRPGANLITGRQEMPAPAR